MKKVIPHMKPCPQTESPKANRPAGSLTDPKNEKEYGQSEKIRRLLSSLKKEKKELEAQNRALRKTQTDFEMLKNDYFDLFEQAPIGYLIVDRIGTIRDGNAVARALLADEKNLIVMKPLTSFLAEESRPIFNSFLSRIRRTHQKQGCDLTVQVPGSAAMSVHIMAGLTQSKRKAKQYILLTLADMTDRKQAEVELQRIFNLTPDVLCVASTDGYFKKINLAAEKILGYTQKELLSRPILELIHPDDIQPTQDEMNKQIHGGSTINFCNRYLCKDGSYKWLEWAAIPSPDGILLYAAARDVTDRQSAAEVNKRTEESLRRSEEQFSKAYHANPVATLMLSISEARILDVNEAYLKLLGYTREEIVGQKSSKVGLWLDPQSLSTLVDSMSGVEIIRDMPNRFITKTGDIRDVLISVEPVELKHERCVLVLAQDITERKRSEEELQASEERFRSLYENASIGLYRTTPLGLILMINPAGLRMLGYTSFDEIGRRHLELEGYEPGYSRDRFRKDLEDAGFVNGIESTWIRQDGSALYVRESATVVRDKEGRILYFDGTFEDITDRRLAERALRDSEQRAQAMLSAIPDMVFRLDCQGVILDYRAASTSDLFEQSNSTFVGKSIRDITPPGFADLVELKIQKTLEAGALQTFEYQLPIPSGGMRDFEARMVPSGTNEVTTIVRDITERNLAEKTIRETNRKLTQAQHIAHIGSWENVLLSGELHWSEEMYFILGFPSGVPVRLEDAARVFPPEELERFRKAVHAAINEGAPYSMDYKIIRLDGSVRFIHDEGEIVRDEHGKAIRMIGTTQEITERKLAEEALRQSEKIYRELFNNTEVGMFRSRMDGSEILNVNEKFAEIYGGRVEEMIGQPSVFQWADPHQRDELLRLIQIHGRVMDFECRLVNKKGEVRDCLTSLYLYTEQGILEGSLMDITVQRQAENALRESEDKYRSLVENSLEGIGLSKENRVFYANKALLNIFGYENLEEFISKPLLEHVAPESRRMIQDIQRNRQAGVAGQNRYTYQILRKDGELRSVEISTDTVKMKNESFTQSTFRDITERKLAEKALKESETKYRSLFEHSIDAILITSPEGSVFSANRAACIMYGMTEDEICRAGRDGLTDLQDPRVAKLIERRARTGYAQGEIIQIRKDGTRFPVDISSAVFETAEGKRAYMILRDITERKEVEKELRESEARFRALTEYSLAGIYIIQDGRLTYVNSALATILGYTSEELIGTDPLLLFHQEDHSFVHELMGRQMAGEYKNIRHEYRVQCNHGESKYINILGVQVMLDGAPAIIGNMVDITDRKLAEEVLRKSEEHLRALAAHLQNIREEERTHIAREIHDELGQQLTALKMDLSFLRKEIEEKGTDESLKHLIKEIISISNFADTTIQTVRRIIRELRPEILDTLGIIAALQWLAEEFEKHFKIRCSATFPSALFELDNARSTALFRITQEALTNISRHSGATGASIELVKENDHLLLYIKDNGRGIEDSDLTAQHSFGLIGMRERALAFGGSVEIHGAHDHGTTLTIQLPLANGGPESQDAARNT